MSLKYIIIVFSVFYIGSYGEAYGDEYTIEEFLDAPNNFIKDKICNSKKLYGLATYYSRLEYYIIDKKNPDEKVELNDIVSLSYNKELFIKGRYCTLNVIAPGFKVSLSDDGELQIDRPDLSWIDNASAIEIKNNRSIKSNNIVQNIIYSSILFMYNLINDWAVSVILMSLIIRIFFYPLDILQVKSAEKVAVVKNKLLPFITEIKSSYKGESAHNKMLELYKKNNVSQLYEIKPLLYAFIQIPILIAVFDVLGGMVEFQGDSFLWINDLSYPDYIIQFDYIIPYLGDGVHLLPILLLMQFIIFTPPEKNKYVMYAILFLLIYPLPSILIVYLIVNVLFKEITLKVSAKLSN